MILEQDPYPTFCRILQYTKKCQHILRHVPGIHTRLFVHTTINTFYSIYYGVVHVANTYVLFHGYFAARRAGGACVFVPFALRASRPASRCKLQPKPANKKKQHHLSTQHQRYGIRGTRHVTRDT